MAKNLTRALLFTLGALAAFGPLTIDLYLPAFVDMAKDLAVSTSDVQFTLTSFLAGLSIGQLVYGPISDRFGRKKPLVFGITLFIVTSIAIGFAHSLSQIVLLRFLQALGSCVGMVITRAIVRDMFDAKEGAQVFSLIILVMGVAPIIAPVLGSQILKFASWRFIFFFLAIFGVLTLIGVLKNIRETLVHVNSLQSGLKNYYHLLFDKQFMICSIVSGTISAALFVYIASSANVFLKIFALEQTTFSIIFASNAAGFIILSQLNAKLLRKYKLEDVLKGGIVLNIAASIALNLAGFLHLGVLPFVLGLWLTIASIGFILPNITAKALEFQHHRAAVASAMMGCIQFLISSFGSIVVSLFGSETYTPMITVQFGFCFLTAFLYLIMLNRSQKLS